MGFIGQVGARLGGVPVPPGAIITLADQLDLTDKYLFEKAGRYSIRFKGATSPMALPVASGPPTRSKGTRVPGSNVITLDVAPGELTGLDQFLIRLLQVRPKGWYVSKSPRNQKEVTPFGCCSGRRHFMTGLNWAGKFLITSGT